jgi:hypothetical protein
MNYYVFSTLNFSDTEEDPTWEIVERFDDLSEAEAYVRANNQGDAKVFRCVPAASEEDAKAHIDMPNQPF